MEQTNSAFDGDSFLASAVTTANRAMAKINFVLILDLLVDHSVFMHLRMAYCA